jgi:hypothetical protein
MSLQEKNSRQATVGAQSQESAKALSFCLAAFKKLTSGADSTITSYKACALKIYSAAKIIARFYDKNYSSPTVTTL